MSEITEFEGHWLSLKKRLFTNTQGEEKSWEYVSRQNSCQACCIVATSQGAHPQIILVKQYRPPIDDYIIEFPAGLIDPGETVAQTALRELAEETGYVGNILEIGPPVYNSAGLTNETNIYVHIEITGLKGLRPEADEDIEVIRWPLHELPDLLKKAAANGSPKIDGKLWFFARALKMME